MRRVAGGTVLLGLLLAAAEALAWGRVGHRLTALVAADHLTPVAAENVRVLLGRESMADVASFGDDYRSEHPETAPWHFVDIPMGEKSYLRERDCPAPLAGGVPDRGAKWRDCVVDRVNYFAEQLRAPETTRAGREFALKMLIHLVGDLHQPMHAIGDARGGNSNRVLLFGSRQCGERYTCNLHGTWDDGLIEHARLSEKKYLATLEAEISELKLADKPVGTAAAWANASHRVAVEAWVPDGGAINEDYYKDELPVLNRELELGGLHLADLLNKIFIAPAPGGEVVKPNSGAPVLTPRER